MKKAQILAAGNEPRILIAGGTGQGKSVYAKNRLKAWQRVIVFDVQAEYEAVPGFKVARSLKEVARLMRRQAYRIAYEPPLQRLSAPECLHELCDFLMRWQDDYRSRYVVPPPLCLVVEEMSISAPNEKQAKHARGFSHVVNMGRKQQIAVIGVTQRVVDIPLSFRQQAQEQVYFRIGVEDAAFIDKQLPKEWRGKIEALPVHSYLHKHNFDIKIGRNSL